MISEGDILLFRFPQSDLGGGKLRPALLIKRIHGGFDDCLVCMISTQIRHQIPDLEVVLPETMPGFDKTGVKKESLIRRVGLQWFTHPFSPASLELYLLMSLMTFEADWLNGFEVKGPSRRGSQPDVHALCCA